MLKVNYLSFTAYQPAVGTPKYCFHADRKNFFEFAFCIYFSNIGMRKIIFPSDFSFDCTCELLWLRHLAVHGSAAG